MNWLEICILSTALVAGGNVLFFLYLDAVYSPGLMLIIALVGEFLVFSILITAWIRRKSLHHIFRPLESLRIGAERVGAGDLKYRTGFVQNDEIGQVAGTFDRMTQRLYESEARLAAKTEALALEIAERQKVAEELRALNAGLDSRVQERTAELLHEVAERKRGDERQALIHGVLRAVSGQLDVEAVACSAVEAIVKYTDWPHVCFAVPDENKLNWVVRGAGGRLAAALGTKGSMSRGVIGRVFRTQQYQLVADTTADPDYTREVENEMEVAEEDTILRSELAVPVRRGRRLLGVLNLESNRVGEFTEEDVQLVQSLADAIALALDNAQLYQDAQREIAERKRAEEKLIYQSLHDYLTGLYNRTYFEETLKRMGNGRYFPVSLLMIDLDTFKQINDRLGHSAGDECLKNAAQVLRTTFRDQGVIARIGGDEFAVLLANTGEESARAAVQRLREVWDDYFTATSLFSKLTSMSIGCATSAPGEKLFNTLRRADRQMYKEKFGELPLAKAGGFQVR